MRIELLFWKKQENWIGVKEPKYERGEMLTRALKGTKTIFSTSISVAMKLISSGLGIFRRS
jgi:hypothetical protein